MSEENKKKQYPLKRGLFQIPEDPNKKPYLTAQRCKACGAYFYSGRKNCLNCGAEPMEVVPLSGRGRLFTYTIVHQQLPGAFMKVPYGIAVVEMEEGVHVSSVVDKDYKNLRVGMEMEVYFEKVAEDKEGNDLLAFKFKAV
jgi:scaffold protein (connect acetoacetyl-CoA thiolase and HMG-CoA synthase)